MASSQSLTNKVQEDKTSTVFVKSIPQLQNFLQDLFQLPTRPPSIYLDASGIGKDELVDLHLLIPCTNTLYLVSIKRLGGAAFSAVDSGDISLRVILESRHIPKVGFDIRDVSQLLFRQFNVSLAGVYDLQLMELASRKDGQSKKFLSGFAKCIDHDVPSSNSTKIRWLSPEDSTDMHLYNTLGHVANSSMKRVELFPILWSVYKRKLGKAKNAVWLHLAREESEQRAHDSKNSPASHPERRKMGPDVFWDHEQRQAAIDAWNDGLALEARLGRVEFDHDAE
ncbi:hypothetical protein CEP53_015296 [Fusarium sp. AF-6]|nr:hypothetical protein CEP53_015296 [Fusarium sp. AF-6]